MMAKRRLDFSDKKTGTGLALLVMFFWGSLFPMIKLGYRLFDIDTSKPANILLFAGIRFVICGLVFLVVLWLKHERPTIPKRRAWPPILAIALTAYMLHYTCTYIGVAHLESAKTGILKQTGTLFIICFAFLFRREDRFTPAKLTGGLLGFFSIIVINLRGFRLTFNVWDMLIIGASCCSVISMVFSKNAYDRHDPLVVTAWAQLLGGLMLLCAGMAAGGRLGRCDSASLGALSYICFASCAGYGLWNVLLKYNNLSRLNIIKFSESLFSALCAWILLGENIFRMEYLAAFVMVCVGIMIGSGLLRPGR